MDITNILIIALVSAGIGVFAGLMISNLRRESEAKSEPTPEAPPPLPEDMSLLDVARFKRDIPNGPLIVEMDGQQYRGVDELSPEMHSHLEELSIEVRNWLGLPQEIIVSSQAASYHGAGNLAPEPAYNRPVYDAPAVEPVQKTGNTGPLPYTPAFQEPEPKKKVPLSIVEQIDAILQENIAGTEFTGRGIRLVELPNQAVVVRVGLNSYPIDAVPDEDVRGLIHAAVAEWELQAK